MRDNSACDYHATITCNNSKTFLALVAIPFAVAIPFGNHDKHILGNPRVRERDNSA